MPSLDLGSVRGPQGEQGIQGIQGIQGVQGAQGVPGAQGATGNGVSGVALISGDHSPGTVDTYRMSFTDGSYTDFTIYNGEDAQVSNINLLDNAWFEVNQRGFTSGNFADHKYTVDRWFTTYASNNNGNVVLNSDNSLTFTGATAGNSYLMQPGAPATVGKTYTISVEMGDGSVISAHGQLQDTTTEIVARINNSRSMISLVYYQVYGWTFVITTAANDTFTVRATKLEPGAVSTLGNDVAPNYTTELLKCQWYFYRIDATNAGTSIGIGIARTSTSGLVLVNVPQMRDTPTAKITGTFRTLGSVTGTVSSVTFVSLTAGVAHFDITANSLGNVGESFAFAGAYGVQACIDLSADL